MGGQRFGVLDSCFLHLYLSSIFSSNGDLKMIEPLKAIYDVGQPARSTRVKASSGASRPS